MTRILTIIALLFATPAWAQSNSADGKSFFCTPNLTKIGAVGLTFRAGKPILIGVDGETETEMSEEYVEALRTYNWNKKNIYWQINRPNLILSMEIRRTNEKFFWQCQINELSEVENKLKSIALEMRNENKF